MRDANSDGCERKRTTALSNDRANRDSNIAGETAKSLLECKAKLGRLLDPDGNVGTR